MNSCLSDEYIFANAAAKSSLAGHGAALCYYLGELNAAAASYAAPRAKASRRAIGKTGFYLDRVLPANSA